MTEMLEDLINRYSVLKECSCEIEKSTELIIKSFESGGKLLLCGNGGSCSDCDHIVGELMKGFLSKRSLSNSKKAEMKNNMPQIENEWLEQLQGGLPAISLPAATALNSAFCNDVSPELVYAQQLMGLANENDIVFCISTSGNSANVYAAAVVAKALGLTVIGLSGKMGGKLKEVADVCICVPETETFLIQELHLPVYHYLCAETENRFFGNCNSKL